VVVPERVFTQAAYEGELLQGIYDQLAEHDPEGVLRHEWVNARGCIARFDRGALEIRVLDTQECPRADVAIAGAVSAVVRGLVEERHADQAQQRSWDENRLAATLREVVRDGGDAVIDDAAYLALFGVTEGPCRAGELWRHLVTEVVAQASGYPAWREPLRVILEHGCLAERIARSLGGAQPADTEIAPGRLHAIYGRLSDCLRDGALFTPDAA